MSKKTDFFDIGAQECRWHRRCHLPGSTFRFQAAAALSRPAHARPPPRLVPPSSEESRSDCRNRSTSAARPRKPWFSSAELVFNQSCRTVSAVSKIRPRLADRSGSAQLGSFGRPALALPLEARFAALRGAEDSILLEIREASADLCGRGVGLDPVLAQMASELLPPSPKVGFPDVEPRRLRCCRH